MQISLFDIYNEVLESMEQQKPELIRTMEERLDFESFIPNSFYSAYNHRVSRNRVYQLESILRALVLQRLLGFPQDAQLLRVLKLSRELRSFCGFRRVPNASALSRFRRAFCDELSRMFERLVDLTEPICRKINEKKADYLIYDTTGIELPISESNPKFLTTKLKEAKKIAKSDPNFDPYKGVYGLLPAESNTNPDAKQQYINGHFCYAAKVGIVTNGLGICRHISVFDDEFLRDKFNFRRACIPMNPRNSKSHNGDTDGYGTPICPVDGTPFICLGKSGGKNRSPRIKWVCHRSEQRGTKRVYTCEHPCTVSSYGKCTYTYPDKSFRLYPGIARNTDHWDNLYRHRVTIERTINLFKDTFALDSRKSYHSVSAKADVFLAGITHLVGVLLADALGKPQFFKSVRELIAA